MIVTSLCPGFKKLLRSDVDLRQTGIAVDANQTQIGVGGRRAVAMILHDVRLVLILRNDCPLNCSGSSSLFASSGLSNGSDSKSGSPT